jgi:membrane-bound ClpP family serine protease
VDALGLALLILGAVLVVAEAHVPGGVLGVAGAIVLMLGGFVVVAGLGGGAALAVPVGLGIGAVAAGCALVVTRHGAIAQRQSVRAGREALLGRIGVVRRWSGPAGQVFVDGALWRAHHAPLEDAEAALHEGDPVVVDRVEGLTLSVHRADEWELTA